MRNMHCPNENVIMSSGWGTKDLGAIAGELTLHYSTEISDFPYMTVPFVSYTYLQGFSTVIEKCSSDTGRRI